MANYFIMKISDDYPESYWFETKVLSGQNPIALKKGEVVSDSWSIEFNLNKKISVDKVLGYDFLFSDGPNFVSPRLHKLLVDENVSGCQFIDADVYINDLLYKDYKVINFTNRFPAFDGSLSKSEPLLSYMPEGPRKYVSIFLKENISNEVDIFRSEEDFTTVISIEKIQLLFQRYNIKGAKFISKWVDNFI